MIATWTVSNRWYSDHAANREPFFPATNHSTAPAEDWFTPEAQAMKLSWPLAQLDHSNNNHRPRFKGYLQKILAVTIGKRERLRFQAR